MTTLPVAVRPKDGGDLVWFSGDDERTDAWTKKNERIVEFIRDPSYSIRQNLHVFAKVPNLLRAHEKFVIGHFVAVSRIGTQMYPMRRTEDRIAPAIQDGFRFSEKFVRLLLDAQADGERREVLSNSKMQALAAEVSERVVEAVADVGYRWVQRKKGASQIASFDPDDELIWCDEELSKLLVFELSISIVSAAHIFDCLFKEIRAALQGWQLRGDWGELVADGDDLTLIPAL